MRYCRYSRDRYIRHCTAWSSRVGSAASGAKARPEDRSSSTRSPPPGVRAWKKKWKVGNASQQPLIWLLMLCEVGMRWFHRVRVLMLMLFNRGTEKSRLNQEFEFHLEQQIAENMSHGMEPDAARAAA